MNRMFGGTTTGGNRMFGGDTSYVPSTEEIIERAEDRPDLYEKPKEKVGILTRLGNLLQGIEPGGEVATLYRTELQKRKEGATPWEQIGAGYKAAGKQYVSEMARGVGSLFPFLDEYTKPNDLANNREGFTEAINEGYKMWGKEPPKSGVGKAAVKTAVIAGDVFLDPSNLFMVGLFAKAFKGLKGGVGLAGKRLSKFEKGRKFVEGIGGIAETGKEAFIPAYKVKKVAPELVDFAKTLKNQTAMGDEEAVAKVVALVKKHGEDVIKKVAYEIEEKGVKGNLSPAARDVVNLIEKETAAEIPLGLRKATIQDYFPHVRVRDISKIKSGYSTGGKQYSTVLDASKTRK